MRIFRKQKSPKAITSCNLKKAPVIEYSDYQALSKTVADLFLSRIVDSSFLRIGLATGNSPKKAYELIGARLMENEAQAKKIEVIQLDEWIGLPSFHTSSCHHYLKESVIRPWKLKAGLYHLLNGSAKHPETEVEELKKLLINHPMDLCILGLGVNGHLALNEPGSDISQGCRIVDLHTSSQHHPMLEPLDAHVTKGMTIGLKEILESREIILIVTGENKQEAFNQLLSNEPVSKCPASSLHLHKNWTCLVDISALN